ncbi:MAG: class I SAM-dependent methyltransferase [Gammaproteobacteria bacterium]|nr:class I SAM-dependent methyltransferase [Gammaproteobacteria bacterium]
MKTIAVIVSDKKDAEQSRQQSKALAEKLSLPIIDSNQASDYEFAILYEADTLKLIHQTDKKMGAVYVDFSKGKSAYRHKHKGKGKLPLSRACGIKQSNRPTIIDATAGLGQDAFVLAGLGCQVLCIEQNPVLSELLADGLARANEGEGWLREIANNIQLINSQAEIVLATKKADVIYLDPMYPHDQNRKHAKVNKGMQLFRAFPGTSSNESELLKSAIAAATDSVVVKRPCWALPLADQRPNYKVPGKTHRYDVYKIGLLQEC